MRSPFASLGPLLCASALVVACGAHEQPPARDTVERGSDAFQRALALARAKRSGLDTPPPPAYAGRASDDPVQYVTGPLKEWGSSAAKRVHDTESAYAEAAREAPSGDVEMGVIVEALAAFESLAQAFVEAGVVAAKAKWPTMPDVVQVFRERMEQDANEAWLLPTLEHCVARADALQLRSAAAQRCRTQLGQIKKRGAEAKAAPRWDSSFDAALAPAPPWAPTAQPEACVFSGSVEPNATWLDLDAPKGADKVPPLAVDQGMRLDVERLELPRAPGEPYRVAVSFPIVARGTLDASARPIALPERIELVAHHVWVESGTPMGAMRIAQDRARLTEKLSAPRKDGEKPAAADAPSPPYSLNEPFPAREPEVDMARSEVSRTAVCARLTLAGAPTTSPPPESQPPEKATCTITPGHRWMTLFADAEGKQAIARIRGPTWLGLQGDGAAFRHVEHDGNRVRFDAWISASLVPPERVIECIGVLIVPKGARRIPDGAPVEVRMRADPDASVVFSLAPRALVGVEKTVGDFDEIRVVGLSGPPFFVKRDIWGDNTR
jgi:hypothetical protein